jgi:Helix-turn-helix domain
MASADLLLHPVRLRIVKAFLGDRALTTGQLAAELDDVPSGSLDRHVARPAKAGVLQVVAERRVRGAVERTYTLRRFAARISAEQAKQMNAEEHAQAFMVYVAACSPTPTATSPPAGPTPPATARITRSARCG